MDEINDGLVKINDMKIDLTLYSGKKIPINVEDMELNANDMLVITGHNGAGKTTFAKLLANENYKRNWEYKSGGIKFNFINSNKFTRDYDNDEQAKLNKMVSFVEQNDDFLFESSAYECLKSPYMQCSKGDNKQDELKMALAFYYYKYFRYYKHNNIIQNDIDKKIKDCYTYTTASKVLEKKDFDTILTLLNKDFHFKYLHKASKYSGGQRKMFHIISYLIKTELLGCKILIMDEPLNNLDGRNKFYVSKIICELRENMNMLILMITHCLVFENVNKAITIIETKNSNDEIESETIRLINKQITFNKDCIEQ